MQWTFPRRGGARASLSLVHSEVYCLATEALVCEWLAQSRTLHRIGRELNLVCADHKSSALNCCTIETVYRTLAIIATRYFLTLNCILVNF